MRKQWPKKPWTSIQQSSRSNMYGEYAIRPTRFAGHKLLRRSERPSYRAAEARIRTSCLVKRDDDLLRLQARSGESLETLT